MCAKFRSDPFTMWEMFHILTLAWKVLANLHIIVIIARPSISDGYLLRFPTRWLTLIQGRAMSIMMCRLAPSVQESVYANWILHFREYYYWSNLDRHWFTYLKWNNRGLIPLFAVLDLIWFDLLIISLELHGIDFLKIM